MSDYYKNLSIIVFTHFDQYHDKNDEKKDSLYGLFYEKDSGKKKELYKEFVRFIQSDYWKKNKNKNLSYEEQEKLERKEVIKEKEILIKKSKEAYYDIDEEKCKELKEYIESKNQKKNCFVSLENGLCYEELNDKYIFYNEKDNKKLCEIKKIENINEYKEIIGLENKDIIIEVNSNLIQIYRLNNDNFILLQNIEINSEGLGQQFIYKYHGCTYIEKIELKYYYNCVKGILGNKFFIIFNHGIKLYGINDKNEYSLISTYNFINDFKSCYEINENNFIFCYNIDIPMSMSGPEHQNYLIEKIELKKNNSNFEFYSKELYEYNPYRERVSQNYCIIGIICLKEKYLIVFIDYYLLIFDFVNNINKKYLISENGEKSLYQYGSSFLCRKNKSDDEFIIFNEKEFTLFKLIENEKQFYVKIIGYYYQK